jgi:mono/diheme cytochrome c family protein
MKFVKLSFVIAAIALFTLACGETTTTTNQTANGTRNSPGTSNTNVNTNAANTSATPADELAEARANYAQFCTFCHGEQGDGGPKEIEGKKLKVPSLKKGHALTHTDEQLIKVVTNGEEGMPAFKDRLKPEQIKDLVRFVRREFQGGANSAKETPIAPKN